jgi:hypothetical protein
LRADSGFGNEAPEVLKEIKSAPRAWEWATDI